MSRAFRDLGATLTLGNESGEETIVPLSKPVIQEGAVKPTINKKPCPNNIQIPKNTGGELKKKIKAVAECRLPGTQCGDLDSFKHVSEFDGGYLTKLRIRSLNKLSGSYNYAESTKLYLQLIVDVIDWYFMEAENLKFDWSNWDEDFFPKWIGEAVDMAEEGYIPACNMEDMFQGFDCEYIQVCNFTREELTRKSIEFWSASSMDYSSMFVEYCEFVSKVIDNYLDK